MRFLLFFLLLTQTTVLVFSQGRVDGFMKGKSNLDIAVGTNIEFSKKYYAGKSPINLARNIYSVNAFFAYGITNKFDVNLSIPYVNVSGFESSIQDLALFLKFQVASIQFKKANAGKLNFILAGGFSSNLTNYQTEGAFALGQQAKVIDVRPVIHYQSNSGVFITAQGGYNYKFEPVPDAAVFALKVGIAKVKWYADIWYDGQIGIGGFDYQGTPPPPSFRELGVDYHKIGGTFYKPIKEYLGVYGGLSYMLKGRNISKGFGFSLGLVFKPVFGDR